MAIPPRLIEVGVSLPMVDESCQNCIRQEILFQCTEADSSGFSAVSRDLVDSDDRNGGFDLCFKYQESYDQGG